MSDCAVELDRMFELVGMVCDDIASSKDFTDLNSIVQDDPEVRDWYLDYCRLHSTLMLELRAERAAQAVYLQIDGKRAIQESNEEDCRMALPPLPVTLPTGLFSSTFHGAVGFFSHELPFSLLIASVLMGFGLWIASLVYVQNPEKVACNSPPRAPSAVSPALEVVGKITGIADVHWADLRTSTEINNIVILGRKYTMASGLMEITYNTGAKVILQGPGTYEVESKNGGFLSVGKLTGKVENKTAQGFSIRTPNARITDLGTEFGVEVDQTETTTLQVFRGTVKMTAATSDGKLQDSEIVLHENESAYAKLVESRPVILRHLPADVTRFARTMPLQETAKTRSDAYGALVLSMQPAVYYRMEMPKDGDPKVLHDSAPGGHHGTIHFADGYVDTTPYAEGRFGQSLRLRGPMVGDYAIVEDYPKATDGRLTIAAWVLALGRSDPSIIAANWILNASHRNEGQFVLYYSYPSNGNFAGRGSDRNGLAAIAIEGKTWESAFPLGTWQHVAQVFDGDVMHLYRNGVEVASCPCRGVLRDPPVKWLSIGCEEIAGIAGKVGFWQGKIDELAVFNHALSVGQIQQLFQGQKMGHGSESSQKEHKAN